jgi:hypothetical protein
MMEFAVELTRDKSAAEPIYKLFDLTESLMARTGASPHLNLAVFDKYDSAKLIDVVSSFANHTLAFSVHFSSIGIFPGAENLSSWTRLARLVWRRA